MLLGRREGPTQGEGRGGIPWGAGPPAPPAGCREQQRGRPAGQAGKEAVRRATGALCRLGWPLGGPCEGAGGQHLFSVRTFAATPKTELKGLFIPVPGPIPQATNVTNSTACPRAPSSTVLCSNHSQLYKHQGFLSVRADTLVA